MNILVSVIYVTYNCSDLALDSIRSLEVHSKGLIYEVIIVDNASRAEERKKLADWAENRTETTRVVYSEENSGFGKANNIGAAYAKGKYLFFLNPDTVVLNDVIGIFYNYLESADKDVAACGGNLLKPDGTPNDSYGNFPGLLQELCHVGLGLSVLLNRYYKKHIAIGSTAPKIVSVVPYIVGADMFIRSDYFRMLQGFDENYFMYYEETDLFFRLHNRGLKAHLLPEARIVHLEGSDANNTNNNKKGFNHKKFEMISISKMYYYKKWLPRYLMPFLKGVLFMQIIVQYFKGKRGSDLRGLLTTHFNIMEAKAVHK
jgi:GT2 family glycosyltransferase